MEFTQLLPIARGFSSDRGRAFAPMLELGNKLEVLVTWATIASHH